MQMIQKTLTLKHIAALLDLQLPPPLESSGR